MGSENYIILHGEPCESEWPYRMESECCSADWDEDTGLCLECKEHANGVMVREE